RLSVGRTLLCRHWLGLLLFHLVSRLAEGVNVTARGALDLADLVLVLADDRVGGICLAFWAVGIDVGTDIVHVLFEDEVHASPLPRELRAKYLKTHDFS